MNARATRQHLGTLQAINTSVPAFQTGGLVGTPPAPRGRGGGEGRGTTVQIINQRGEDVTEADIERRPRGGPGGDDLIRITIRDTVRSGIEDGDFGRGDGAPLRVEGSASLMPTWPADLPQEFEAQGFRDELPDDELIRSDIESPAEKTRRAPYRANTSPISGQMAVTADQWDELIDFYRNDIADGALEFDFPDPDDEASTIRVAFAEPPVLSTAGGEDSRRPPFFRTPSLGGERIWRRALNTNMLDFNVGNVGQDADQWSGWTAAANGGTLLIRRAAGRTIPAALVNNQFYRVAARDADPDASRAASAGLSPRTWRSAACAATSSAGSMCSWSSRATMPR